MPALYNSQGTWSSTVQYNYLDSVQYGKYTYICTESSGSLNQIPPNTSLVWVQMPVITQEDQFYLRSRTDLLQYEDARFNSLINAMANYYTMRNDQSVWGSFLRAVAIELARIEYMYSYDVIAKNPSFLTPPDIKREYANPLFVTGNFQQTSQFDSGDFGSSFGQWAADTGIILRTAILDSNSNIQIATTAGTTGLIQPSWPLTPGATVNDGYVVWTNAGAAPTPLAYPIGYRDMLVDLMAAYQEGATAKSIQDVIYAYTGRNIIVEELYKEIVPGGFYDQSDRNSVKVSVNIGGTDPFTDIESLTELQQITNSLYGAIDLAKPAHVGLEFTTVFGADENIDCFISPQYLTQTQLNTLPESQQVYYVLIAYVHTRLGWSATTEFNTGTVIQDSNGFLQYATIGGLSGTIKPEWNSTLQGTTVDGQVTWTNVGSQPTGWFSETLYSLGDTIQDYNGNIQLVTVGGVSSSTLPSWNTILQGVTTDGQVTWVNIGTQQITIAAFNALSTAQQVNYQGYYQDLNCNGTGINDTLRIIIQQYEEPPFDPMLYQAPIYNVANPTTTLASYGRMLLTPISQTNWGVLQSSPATYDITGSTTYPKGTLVRGRVWNTSGSFNPTTNTWTPGGWQLYRANKKTSIDPLTDATETYWTALSSPSIYQAYYKAKNGQFVIGLQQWSPNTSFYTGQFMLDNNGNLQIASTQGISSPVVNVASSAFSVTIQNNVLTLNLNGTGTLNMWPQWTAGATYTVGSYIVDFNGNVQVVTTGGISGYSTPIFNKTIGEQTPDSGVVWTNTNPANILITLLGFTYATFLNGLTLPLVSFTSNSISMTYVNSNYSSGTMSEGNATVQIGLSQSLSTPTYDGTIIWQFLGSNYLNNPAKWIQVVNSSNNVTGEVANWDVTHPMGLVAPRLDLCWEISGMDTLQILEIE